MQRPLAHAACPPLPGRVMMACTNARADDYAHPRRLCAHLAVVYARNGHVRPCDYAHPQRLCVPATAVRTRDGCAQSRNSDSCRYKSRPRRTSAPEVRITVRGAHNRREHSFFSAPEDRTRTARHASRESLGAFVLRTLAQKRGGPSAFGSQMLRRQRLGSLHLVPAEEPLDRAVLDGALSPDAW